MCAMPPGTSYGMASLVSVNWPHADWCLHSDRMVTFAIFFLSPFGPSGDVKFIPTFYYGWDGCEFVGIIAHAL